MNRLIKFRAWHKKEKRMFIVAEYMPPVKPAFVGAVRDNDLDKDYSLKEVEIMQFTGVYDKKKREIYEGDIFKSSTVDYNESVIFKDGCFVSDCNEHEFRTYEDIEIIGNIYTNPELLEDEL